MRKRLSDHGWVVGDLSQLGGLRAAEGRISEQGRFAERDNATSFDDIAHPRSPLNRAPRRVGSADDDRVNRHIDRRSRRRTTYGRNGADRAACNAIRTARNAAISGTGRYLFPATGIGGRYGLNGIERRLLSVP